MHDPIHVGDVDVLLDLVSQKRTDAAAIYHTKDP